MNHKLLLFFLCIIGYSCNNSSDNIERFFIPQDGDNNGIINKYYINIYPKNQQSKKTIIDYSLIEKINDSIYRKERYSPSFQLQSSKQFRIEGKDFIEVNYERYFLADTLIASYPDDRTMTYTTFGKDTVHYRTSLKNKDSLSRNIHQSSTMVKDTIIQNKPAKIVEQNTTNITTFGKIFSDTLQLSSRSIYVQDLGLYSSTLTTDKDVIERILVEQLLPSEFDKLSNHTIKRVGYIDFAQTIDKDKELELCLPHKLIADYYNGGNDRAGFIGGKSNLKKWIYSKLDTKKLNNESGYLTFRFVINCKGIAGKFTTDESADFDYNKKEFSQETVMHLYDILADVKQWEPVIIRNKKRDSYFYVTFILKNGKIQDILP
ncbi:hypothetical protein D1818_02070 [Aquimarina sp. BL5]|uniref:hypothetical protein n=1 Tax=Aquimarina sp. BL5 TaxID=1714860 RepID=UPI000E50E1FA|nr:hypothetical protein [Aquimarina sp. BL5]AXT49664.1 hypothetical protein D1818_02070 [Aquimarina sp. BL5]RKM96913.1 hypothetical protein D7036_20680 [Aquimarina sp. BL5]